MAILLTTARAMAVPTASLPGDADCDGLVTSADLAHVTSELTDGDGELTADADGGTVASCSGADANQDGLINAADLLAVTRLLFGDTSASGPVITFIGIASADGRPAAPVSSGHVPLYQAVSGFGFRLVIEAAPSALGIPVGERLGSPRPGDPTGRADVQIEVTHDLGDGNRAVCGEGGVPGVAPPNYGPGQPLTDALNDLACRLDVAGTASAGCTVDSFGAHRFADPRTRVQFCLPVSTIEAFPLGRTIVTARVLDVEGNPGPVAQMVLRIGPDILPTDTPRSTATPTASATITETGVASVTATESVPPTVTATEPAPPTPTTTRIATATAVATPSLTPSGASTRTATATVTRTATNTLRPTATASTTLTPTGPTPTRTRTPRKSATPTDTRTATGTPTGPPTRTASDTPTPTRTRFGTATMTGTATASRTPTSTGSPMSTRTATPTATGSPPRTNTATRTATTTRTSLASSTATQTGTGTRSPRPTATSTGSATGTQTRTPTATRTLTGTVSPAPSATVTRSGTQTRTATATRTPTSTGSPTITRPPTATGSATRTGTTTRTPTRTATPSLTRTSTSTRTPTRTWTPSWTPTITRTPSPTGTQTIPRSPTATPRTGADVTYVGLARADDKVIAAVGMTAQGWPIYQRPVGFLFNVIIEAKPGPNRRPVGLNAFRYSASDASVRPDLEVIVSRPLGDGSVAVCDNMLPMLGGVPASAGFDITPQISGAINDFACRFVNGSGNPGGRSSGEACTSSPDGDFRFVNGNSTAQFCAGIAEPFGFPAGDTVVTVRVRDSAGNPGPPASFVVRVMP